MFWRTWGRPGIEHPTAYALKRAEWAMRSFIRAEAERRTITHLPETEPSRSLPRRIRRAVRSLSRRHREPLLAWLARTPNAETQATLGLSKNVMNQRRLRGIAMLTRKLNPAPKPLRKGGRPLKHDWPTVMRLLTVHSLTVPEVALQCHIDAGVIHNYLCRQRKRGRMGHCATAGMASFATEPHCLTIPPSDPSLSLS